MRGPLVRSGLPRARPARRAFRAACRTTARAGAEGAGDRRGGGRMNGLDLHDSPFAGRSLIEASAGTGKTWTLTALYARLLLERQLSVGQILVVTYTTAATAERRERIRARLAELLALYEGGASDDAFLIELHRRHPDEAS